MNTNSPSITFPTCIALTDFFLSGATSTAAGMGADGT
jgi:hypothetical protein